ncbi:MAG: conjugal transfer protein TraG N-terminal domain-containing protein [Gammaproteobacteria bacterium]|nr:conjugal transfer protein TraG N-terminal domain-containing protein [Gammaproteobacteria bacterium]
MAMDVITHGGGEGLSHTFNAIAALFNGKGSVGCTLIYISGSFAMAMAVMTLVIKQEFLPSVRWFVASLLLMNVLMLPKINIIIRDRMTNLVRPVANVPFVLGAFAGIASQMGDILAQHLDNIFAPAGDVMKYRSHGVAMASGLLSKSADFSISDPDAAANLKAFVQNCMVFDIAKGKYSLKALLETPDVWAFLKKNASPIRGFPYRVGPNQTQIMTCAKSMENDDKQLEKLEKDAKHFYGPALYPGQSKEEAMSSLMSNVGLSYHYLTGLSTEASLILRQNMMRNIIKDALLENNQIHNASAAVTAYATTRAQAQQRTAYQLQGNMASLALSTLKVVVEVLFYGLFPIMVAVSLFPGGLAIIKKYIIALFWIQSWAPLYSILNMVVNLYGKSKSMAAMHGGTLGISSIRPLTEANEWVSAVAGYTMMSVPFLSYGMIHYGAGALSQLSTHFGSIGQSAASHAAEEATTGNYSLANTHFDNHNLSNTTAFKYDTNSVVAAGKHSAQNLDGSLVQSMPNNKPLLDMTGAVPKLNSNLKLSNHVSNALNQNANESWQMGTQELEGASTNLNAVFNRVDEWKESRSKDTSDSTAYNQHAQSFQETAFSRYYDLVKDFSKNHYIDDSIGLELFAQVGMGVPLTKNEVGLRGSAKTTQGQHLKEAQQYSDKHGMSQLLRQSLSEGKEGRLNFLDAEHQSQAESMTALFGNTESQLTSAQTHFAYAKGYQQHANLVEQNALQMDQDLSPQYWSHLVSSEGLDAASKIVSDPQANLEHMQSFAQRDVNRLKQEFQAHAATPEEVEAKFLREQDKMRQAHSVEGIHAQHQTAIQERVLDAGLNEPINLERKENFDTESKRTQEQLEIRANLLDVEKRALASSVAWRSLGSMVPKELTFPSPSASELSPKNGVESSKEDP